MPASKKKREPQGKERKNHGPLRRQEHGSELEERGRSLSTRGKRGKKEKNEPLTEIVSLLGKEIYSDEKRGEKSHSSFNEIFSSGGGRKKGRGTSGANFIPCGRSQ